MPCHFAWTAGGTCGGWRRGARSCHRCEWIGAIQARLPSPGPDFRSEYSSPATLVRPSQAYEFSTKPKHSTRLETTFTFLTRPSDNSFDAVASIALIARTQLRRSDDIRYASVLLRKRICCWSHIRLCKERSLYTNTRYAYFQLLCSEHSASLPRFDVPRVLMGWAEPLVDDLLSPRALEFSSWTVIVHHSTAWRRCK